MLAKAGRMPGSLGVRAVGRPADTLTEDVLKCSILCGHEA